MKKVDWEKRKKMLIAKVHVAKRQIGLDDDVYREWIREVSRKRTDTSKELHINELQELIRKFKRYGWVDRKELQKAALWRKMESMGREIWGDEWQEAVFKIAKNKMLLAKLEWINLQQLKQMVAILTEILKHKHKRDRQFKVIKGKGV